MTTMICSMTDTMLTLAQAAREVPNRSGGRGVDVATVWRWTSRGIHDQRLETLLVGGIRFTSREALQRFFWAVTAAADGTGAPRHTSRERERAGSEAKQVLIAEGA